MQGDSIIIRLNKIFYGTIRGRKHIKAFRLKESHYNELKIYLISLQRYPVENWESELGHIYIFGVPVYKHERL